MKVSLYLINTLVGTYVFICFQSIHSQFSQFNFMLGISVWFMLCTSSVDITVGISYFSRSVFPILHAPYIQGKLFVGIQKYICVSHLQSFELCSLSTMQL